MKDTPGCGPCPFPCEGCPTGEMVMKAMNAVVLGETRTLPVKAGCVRYDKAPHPTLMRQFLYDEDGIYGSVCCDCGHKEYHGIERPDHR